MKEKLILLVGPTASGKTEIGIRIANKIDGEIISANSMQVYKYMDIGTAKVTNEEAGGIPHYLIDVVKPDEDFSVAMFKSLSEKYIEDILNRGKRPIVVGGTGLYINALTKPWNVDKAEPDEDLRNRLHELANSKGKEYLHKILKRIDPDAAENIHPNNVKRVIRAIEVYEVTGKTKTQLDKEAAKEGINYDPVLLGLKLDRKLLYRRIEDRVDKMLEEGLIEEVKDLLKRGYSTDLVSMQGLGYKEIAKYLLGEWTKEEAIEILKRDTRRFAKGS